MRFIHRVLSALFAVFACSAFAGPATDWRVYRAADGLPETAISGCTVGPRGTLWLRHPNQPWISRLNGYDVTALPDAKPNQGVIHEGPSGQLCRIDRQEIDFYIPQKGTWYTALKFTEVESALFARPGNEELPALIPLKQDQVMLMSPKTVTTLYFRGNGEIRTNDIIDSSRLHLGNFRSMISSTDGAIWIVGNHGFARSPGPVREITAESVFSEFITDGNPASPKFREFSAPVADPLGGISIVGKLGDNLVPVLLNHDGTRWFTWTNLPPNTLKAWRTSSETIAGITPTAFFTTHLSSENSVSYENLPINHINDASPEPDGAVWLATSEGLFRYAPPLWQTVGNLEFCILNSHGIASGESGKTWLVFGDRLVLNDNYTSSSFALTPRMSMDTNLPSQVFGDKDHHLYVGVEGQLWYFDTLTHRASNPEPLSISRINPLAVMPDGKLCVERKKPLGDEAAKSSLELFDGRKFFPLSPAPPEDWLKGGVTLCDVSTNGSMWFYGHQGIGRLNHGIWQIIPFTNAPSAQAPSSMVEAAPGILWFGMGDAIVQFDSKSWSTLRAGFYHIHQMLKAGDGSIWVASDNGIHRYQHGTWMDNGVEEGLPAASVGAVCESPGGVISVLTTRGLGAYHPEADTDAPRTSIQSSGGTANSFREGELSTFIFNGLDRWKVTSPERLLYSYRLDDLAWSPYQEQRSTTFLDLIAGNHHLQVRSMDRNWNVELSPTLFEFAVVVPWYREGRLVFISGLGLAAALFFAVIALNRHRRLVKSFAEVEAMVALRTEQLDKANQELFHSQKMNALGTLAAGIAHDFNNILSIIKGSVQIIEDNLDNQEKIKIRADRIRTVVDQGTGIVHAMLGFSRTSDHQPVACDANELVKETITLLGDRFLREVSVQFEPPVEALPQMEVSRDYVQQILLNFIFNAADASPQHQPIVVRSAQAKTLPKTMALKPELASEYVTLSVHDRGVGIAPEVMPRIFEPFFTTKAMSTKRGTGLGLSMAYELAKQMKCGLGVESTPGQGSVFTLYVPVKPSTQ